MRDEEFYQKATAAWDPPLWFLWGFLIGLSIGKLLLG